MGRVSKRGISSGKAVSQQADICPIGKQYKAGIYARLSSDQNERKNESIDVQIEIAKKYVDELNREKTGDIIDIVQCYTDLGKSGSNFEREGFLRMLQDIRLGEIDCVIVKDLSRFGRNYLEAGNYIEKIFPFLGVRFIAVADGFDTVKAGNENKQMVSEIKNLVNDMYAKDFSKKAKISLKQRREEGSYVGGPPPYGYVAEWKGKKRILMPDDNTADIVRLIYERFVETESYTAVADKLNEMKVNPPAIYKKCKEVFYSADEKDYKGWDKSAIERIVKSNTYLGTLVQGKTSITAREEKGRIHKSEDEWVISKDTHKPLIDMELFEKAVEIREKISQKSISYKHPTKGYPLEENIFDNILFCGVCGKKMTRNSYVKHYVNGKATRLEGYFCLNGERSKVTVCSDSNRISKTELLDILLPLIRFEFAVILHKPKKYMEFGKERVAEAMKKKETALRNTERRIKQYCEEESSVYMDYKAARISQKEYVVYKVMQEDKLIDLRKRVEEQKKEIHALEKLSARYLAAIRALIKLKSGKELTKEMVELFISKIYVYPGKRIEVLFAFTTDCMEGVE